VNLLKVVAEDKQGPIYGENHCLRSVQTLFLQTRHALHPASEVMFML